MDSEAGSGKEGFSSPKELETMRALLSDVLRIVRDDYRSAGLKKDLKRGLSVVTYTDVKVDNLIRGAIQKNFPKDTIISEESAPEMVEGWRQWLVDPLCGSSNFSSGVLSFATNVSLFENGKPVFGFVIDHPNQTHYWASRDNKGVYEDDKKVSAEIEMGVRSYINIDPGFLMDNQSPDLVKFGSILKDLNDNGYYFINYGTSLSFVHTALGKYGGTIVADVNPWDVVASCYLIEKNGGVATDFSGKKWDLKTRDFVLSLDPQIHEKLLAIVKKHWGLTLTKKT